MDKYDASHDHYCYPNSSVLKNHLAITEADLLEQAEREITTLTIQQVHYLPPPYHLEYLKKLHFDLFSVLYPWAGELRTVDIAKGGTRFCHCMRIEPEANKLFAGLQQLNWLQGLGLDVFCQKLAEYYCEFNMIHPFREGNGRTQRIMFEHLALSAGYELDWSEVSQSEWIQANIDGVYVNYEPMRTIFRRVVRVVG